MISKIAIFASGQGSNARRFLEYFKDHPTIRIDLIVCNRKDAGVLEIAREWGVDRLYCPKDKIGDGSMILESLRMKNIQWIVLAGYLLKVPELLIHSFPNRIINIHPALLPKFGGKGMYGDHVHEAVIKEKESKSGISIHFVDENYDTGSLIAQHQVEVDSEDDVNSLRRKIQKLEQDHYPVEVEKLIDS